MRTIALRFSNNFAPSEGTIQAHQIIIDIIGSVWYGKLGSRISAEVAKAIMTNDTPKILLIHSGGSERYWAYTKAIQYVTPEPIGIPEYYRNRACDFKTWFQITRFEKAPSNILSKCTVASSGKLLTVASRHSMSPYFIIDYTEG